MDSCSVLHIIHMSEASQQQSNRHCGSLRSHNFDPQIRVGGRTPVVFLAMSGGAGLVVGLSTCMGPIIQLLSACGQVGPELEIPGYGCEDHFLEQDTIEHSWECVLVRA